MTAAAEPDASLSPLAGPSSPMASSRPTNPFVRFEQHEVDQSIPDRFEEQVRRYPDKLAVKTTRGSLTYAELNRLANQITHVIVARRGGSNEPVALLFDQGALMIAAILGTLKAGKFYLPLDPLHSAPRNADLLADSSAAIILTDASNCEKAHACVTPEISVLNLDAIGDGVPAENLASKFAPDRLAYLFYTSGSTGKPKGLADTHRNVLHNIMRYTNSLHVCAADRLTLLQSASFSGSVSSLFCALLNGATSLPFSLQQEGPERLAAWVSEEEISIYHSVPSIFRLLATGKHQYPALRVIRLEGDQASPRDIELYKTHFPDTCILVNGLGATECGIVRQYFVTKDTPVPESIVPIGYAVQDMEILLLDESGQPIGFDCVGEVAVRSRYLAPGYWRRPNLTEAAFLPDPQGGTERIYRTGDLGRMRPDGCLEYLGRKNFQLRIRGQWVEIAEIEKALRSLGAFQDVVVLTLAEQSPEPRLVAYLVPNESPTPKIDEIRRHLAQCLPAYMIPTAFVMLDALPLNPFGKLDRRALPAPSHVRPDLKEAYVDPHNTLQLHLKQIWEEVLCIVPIGIRDNFFDLGGDSLRALHMILQVEQVTQKTIPPELLLGGATIEHLADYISNQTEERQAPIVEIQKGTSGKAFYFLHGDYLTAGYYCLDLARRLGPNRAFYALPPCGVNGFPVPDSYEEMATLHIQALRAHQPVGPYMLGGACNGGLIAYEMARKLAADGERIEALVVIAATAANVRFRRLAHMVFPLRLLSRGLEKRVFGRLQCVRNAFERLQRFMRALVQLPHAQRPAFVLSKFRRRLEPLRDIIRKRGDGNQGHAKSADTWLGAPPHSAVREALREAYHRMKREYVPGPYPGTVALFWWEGKPESYQEAVRWWSKVAGRVELYMLPGGRRNDSLTAYVKAVAETLKSYLDSVD